MEFIYLKNNSPRVTREKHPTTFYQICIFCSTQKQRPNFVYYLGFEMLELTAVFLRFNLCRDRVEQKGLINIFVQCGVVLTMTYKLMVTHFVTGVFILLTPALASACVPGRHKVHCFSSVLGEYHSRKAKPGMININFLFQSLTREISYSMENLAFDSLLR